VKERSECVRSRRGVDTNQQLDLCIKYNTKSIIPFVCFRCRDSSDRLMAANDQNDKIKRLKRQKLLSKITRNVPDHNGWSDRILFLLLSMVMLDFTWWPDAEEEAGKSPLSTNHAATRFPRYSPTLFNRVVRSRRTWSYSSASLSLVSPPSLTSSFVDGRVIG
jgi:hypothetical protein